jgi:hypothetical protein
VELQQSGITEEEMAGMEQDTLHAMQQFATNDEAERRAKHIYQSNLRHAR